MVGHQALLGSHHVTLTAALLLGNSYHLTVDLWYKIINSAGALLALAFVTAQAEEWLTLPPDFITRWWHRRALLMGITQVHSSNANTGLT